MIFKIKEEWLGNSLPNGSQHVEIKTRLYQSEHQFNGWLKKRKKNLKHYNHGKYRITTFKHENDSWVLMDIFQPEKTNQ